MSIKLSEIKLVHLKVAAARPVFDTDPPELYMPAYGTVRAAAVRYVTPDSLYAVPSSYKWVLAQHYGITKPTMCPFVFISNSI